MISIEDTFAKLRNYLIGFLLIVSTRGIWLYVQNSRISYGQVSIAVTALLGLTCIIGLLTYVKVSVKKTSVAKICITLFCLVFYFFINSINRSVYGYLFAAPIIAGMLYFVFEKDKNQLWFAFEDAVVILAAVSLVFYIGGTVLDIIPNTGIATFEWAYTRTCRTFFSLYYEAQRIKGASFSLRNCGIFPEAPMYNMVLCTALAVEMFLRPQRNNKRMWLLIVTIVTTLSSTGYLFVILSLLLDHGEKAFRTHALTLRKLIYILMAAAGVVLLFALFNYRLTYQSGINSNAVRFDHIAACFKTWGQNIFTGCGYGNLNAVFENAVYEQGISIGLPYLLATGGIVLGTPVIGIYLFNAVLCRKNRDFGQFAFETMIMLLYFLTAVTGTPLMGVFIAYIASVEI